jgi:lipoic acid synthetase
LLILNESFDKMEFKNIDRKRYALMVEFLKKNNLNTVCIEANCPNRYYCFSQGNSTFMILGRVCTRNCFYCNVSFGKPSKVDSKEPERIAFATREMGLNYVVITSVTRDDLKDFGSMAFVNCINEIRKVSPKTKVEVLVPDFCGDFDAIKSVVDSKPFVFNHNIEVVKRLFPVMRKGGRYDVSLKVLKYAKSLNTEIYVKSGLMVGLGESIVEVFDTIKDLKGVGCDFLSVGQYLSPSEKHAKVIKFYSDKEFEDIKKFALAHGFLHVESGENVRSSYRAKQYSKELNI